VGTVYVVAECVDYLYVCVCARASLCVCVRVCVRGRACVIACIHCIAYFNLLLMTHQGGGEGGGPVAALGCWIRGAIFVQ